MSVSEEDRSAERKIIALEAFDDNYIWLIREGEHAAVVDPGDAEPVLDYLRDEHLRLIAILNTHHHGDHVGGNARLLEYARVPVYGPRDEAIATVTERTGDGDTVSLTELTLRLRVLGIPGHTAGHIAFVGEGYLFCGDTLFACGCGRLFEGTPAQMLSSLDKLAGLPDHTEVYCGHEYTLANLRFARAVEPTNVEISQREKSAKDLRARSMPTLPTNIVLEKLTNPFMRSREPKVIKAVQTWAGRDLSDPVSVFAALRAWKDRF